MNQPVIDMAPAAALQDQPVAARLRRGERTGDELQLATAQIAEDLARILRRDGNPIGHEEAEVLAQEARLRGIIQCLPDVLDEFVGGIEDCLPDTR